MKLKEQKSVKGECFQWVCQKCGKVIKSVSEAQQTFNVAVHSAICKKTAENLVKSTPTGNIHRK